MHQVDQVDQVDQVERTDAHATTRIHPPMLNGRLLSAQPIDGCAIMRLFVAGIAGLSLGREYSDRREDCVGDSPAARPRGLFLDYSFRRSAVCGEDWGVLSDRHHRASFASGVWVSGSRSGLGRGGLDGLGGLLLRLAGGDLRDLRRIDRRSARRRSAISEPLRTALR